MSAGQRGVWFLRTVACASQCCPQRVRGCPKYKRETLGNRILTRREHTTLHACCCEYLLPPGVWTPPGLGLPTACKMHRSSPPGHLLLVDCGLEASPAAGVVMSRSAHAVLLPGRPGGDCYLNTLRQGESVHSTAHVGWKEPLEASPRRAHLSRPGRPPAGALRLALHPARCHPM